MTVRILQGDAREILTTLPEASVDACVTDPPYGETKLEWDVRVKDWLPEVRRVLKPHGSLWCFGSLRFFMDMAGEFEGWILVQEIVWEKHNGSNSAADRFRRVHELAAHFRPADVLWRDVYQLPQYTHDATARQVRRKQRPAHWGSIGEGHYMSEDGGPRLMRSVLYARSCHGRAIHPTQKPEAIVEPLVKYSCPPKGTVLDPFAGSGTTGLVADRLGMNAVLIELDLEDCEKARRRIREDSPLFPSEVLDA